MNTLPLIPENAPFTEEQRAWLNGFLAGWLGQAGAAPASTPAVTAGTVLVLFGSQSGTAEGYARQMAKQAKARGFDARVKGLDAADPQELASESRLLLVTSTWGEGEMPDNAKAFWDKLNNGAPRLENLAFSVLSFGDTNYADTFCQAGKLFDARFEALGAKRVHPRVDCDVDYETVAAAWLEGALGSFGEGAAPAPQAAPVAVQETPAAPGTRKNPVVSRLLHKRCLNKEGSAKDVHHIEFSLEGVAYETGDALGVFPENCPEVVDAVLGVHGFAGDELVPLPDGGEAPLREALIRHYEVCKLVGAAPAAERPAAADFVGGLKKLNPRLYSISSSPKAHPGQVHATVGAVRYEQDGVAHKGVCSTFLADRLAEDGEVRVFIQPSHGFRLPSSGDVPVIMIGPGTGIAPFRAFLEEREASGAQGKNWLFFGDQHAATDFLYEEQLRAWREEGHLARLDTAFSRDQEEKIYVQHRILEHGAELWSWLSEGAHLYVCGDASRMAKDVDAALRGVVAKHGGMTDEAAGDFLKQLKTDKRYQRDVY